MSLPDNDYVKLLADEPVPPPSANRRADALLKANIAFREKVQAKTQQVGFFKRLLGIGPHTSENKMKMRTLMGGSALALVGILSVSVGTDYLRQSTATTTGYAQFQSLSALSDGSASEAAATPRSSGGAQLSDMISNTGSRMPSIGESITSFFTGDEKESRARAEQSAAAPTPEYRSAVQQLDAQRADASRGQGASAIPTPMQNPVGAPQFQNLEILSADSSVQPRRAPAPGVPASPAELDYERMPQPQGTDSFANLPDSPLQDVAKEPISTFSADVDTASYSTVRRMLQGGQMPPPNAVRTEEMINYFNYNYPLPESRSQPFAPTVAVYDNPWNKGTQLVHIGIKAFDLPAEARPPVNLVLLVDVSGSMSGPDKLGLVKSSFGMLLDQLKPTDTVAIVTYAGNSGIALEPTKAAEREKIMRVLSTLGAGGSTGGEAGLREAYELARRNYNKEGVNRILLATDGDFNVGVSEPGGLAQYVASQRSSGIFLSVLGYGMGNYQDSTMQALAQNGNGTAAYIDGMSEARRVMSEQVSSTLFTVAKDVKFQVEFNPAQVQSYRLLGYETRALRTQDFNNDKVDAGEVGAGSEVTAIYEVVPAGSTPATGSSRYQNTEQPVLGENRIMSAENNEIGHLRIRYKLPDSDTSTLIERPIVNSDRTDLREASVDVRFATAVAGFSRLLRNSAGVTNFGYNDVLALADGARGEDRSGERIGFIDLVRTAQAISGMQPLPAEEGGVAFPPPPR